MGDAKHLCSLPIEYPGIKTIDPRLNDPDPDRKNPETNKISNVVRERTRAPTFRQSQGLGDKIKTVELAEQRKQMQREDERIRDQGHSHIPNVAHSLKENSEYWDVQRHEDHRDTEESPAHSQGRRNNRIQKCPEGPHPKRQQYREQLHPGKKWKYVVESLFGVRQHGNEHGSYRYTTQQCEY